MDLDDDLRQLTFYSVQSGDTIYLRWWLLRDDKFQMKATVTTSTKVCIAFLHEPVTIDFSALPLPYPLPLFPSILGGC